MNDFIRKLPSFVLFLLLALVYLGCGYVAGYYQGYRAGQNDYMIYIENLLGNENDAPAKTEGQSKPEFTG